MENADPTVAAGDSCACPSEQPQDETSTSAPYDRAGASNSYTIRLKLKDEESLLNVARTTIEKFGFAGATDPIASEEDGSTVWDILVYLERDSKIEDLEKALNETAGVTVINWSDRTFLAHLGGKISIMPRMPIKTREDLSILYTPGVARVSWAIYKDPEKVWTLTSRGNMIAVASNGTRVLALGDIGPEAAMAVMEGKCVLFKQFGGVDAVPLLMRTKDPKKIIEILREVSVTYGGINLEDIASPGCWEIENELKKTCDIPVFHDDQHGTAVVVLAGVLNAARLVKKQLRHLRVVVSGVGAAGMACCRLLIKAGVRNIIGFKREGAVYRGRADMNDEEKWLADNSNPKNLKCCLTDALKGADMFLGLSVADVIKGKDLVGMRRDPIVFALANPQPEVKPEDAKAHGARIIATGGSEYPNQVNNALAFPGIFRGALGCRAKQITDEMKMAAAHAIANVIPVNRLRDSYIIPSIFDERVHKAVAAAVTSVAYATGQARRVKRTR